MIIAVDYGEKTCGLAQSVEGKFATPLISVKTQAIFSKLKELNPEVVVIGISEGKSKEAAEKFAKLVENMLGCRVELVDETLTTVEAQKLSKDKDKEHSLAAAIILERYLGNV
ncbi:MAG: Holliday junction resolvase RuvX [bacterium]|nr:Holliday junction resolvase RuvX [bacterium]